MDFLFNAFKFGAPPHGGSAPGIDRIIMLLSNEENLREVVAFPMNQQAEDLMLGSPSDISAKHLKELGINVEKKKLFDFLFFKNHMFSDFWIVFF